MQPNARIVVLTLPKVRPDQLLKRALLLARVPRGSRILGVNSLPNILELMGMPSGGGPPGFSVLVPGLPPEEPKHPLTNILIAGYPPGAALGGSYPLLGAVCSDGHILGSYIGACTSAGLLINYFELVLSDDERWASTVGNDLIQMFAAQAIAVLPLEEYKVPAELRKALEAQGVKG